MAGLLYSGHGTPFVASGVGGRPLAAGAWGVGGGPPGLFAARAAGRMGTGKGRTRTRSPPRHGRAGGLAGGGCLAGRPVGARLATFAGGFPSAAARAGSRPEAWRRLPEAHRQEGQFRQQPGPRQVAPEQSRLGMRPHQESTHYHGLATPNPSPSDRSGFVLPPPKRLPEGLGARLTDIAVNEFRRVRGLVRRLGHGSAAEGGSTAAMRATAVHFRCVMVVSAMVDTISPPAQRVVAIGGSGRVGSGPSRSLLERFAEVLGRCRRTC